MDYYPSEHEDFAAADSSKLDTWVFDKVKVCVIKIKKNTSFVKERVNNIPIFKNPCTFYMYFYCSFLEVMYKQSHVV